MGSTHGGDDLHHRTGGAPTNASPSIGGGSDGASDRALVTHNHPEGWLSARGTPRENKPVWKNKRTMICFCLSAPVVLVIVVVILVYVVLAPVAQHTLNTTHLFIDQSEIIAPTNTSFGLHLVGRMKKAGIFPAHVKFPNPVTVSWVDPDSLQELHIGQFNLEQLAVGRGHGTMDQHTNFNIAGEPKDFSKFTGFMMTAPQFTWRLRSDDVKVKAFGFLAAHGRIDFHKDLNINGMAAFDPNGLGAACAAAGGISAPTLNSTSNSLSDAQAAMAKDPKSVRILDFQLPGDHPDGGIATSVLVRMFNQSPFGVDLGTLTLGLYYEGMYLGPAVGNDVILTPESNEIRLNGRLIPHTNATELGLIGQLMSHYLNGDTIPIVAKGESVHMADGSVISWLSDGVKALTMNVPLVSITGPIHPIQAIEIGSLNLSYTPETSYSPLTTSDDLSAKLQVPFGFDLSVTQLANSFSIVENDIDLAALSSPLGPALSSDIRVISSNQTEGLIKIGLPTAPLVVPNSEDGHNSFDHFQTNLTTQNGINLFLRGSSQVYANTPVGPIVLDPINFFVPSGLRGLEGLQSQPTLILGVDVTGGTSDHISLAINVSMYNPSNLNLNVGDVTFQLSANGSDIGTTTLPNLNLVMGNQTVGATGVFRPNDSTAGLETLNNFVNQIDSTMQIAGFAESTKILSLVEAFEALHLDTVLPGLKTKLLQSANVTILPTTGAKDDMAAAVVSLVNPFSAGLRITKIKSDVASHGIPLGSIDTSTDFPATGKTTAISPDLPFAMNLDPSSIFTLLRVLAVQAGEGTDQLDGIVKLGGYNYLDSDGKPRRRSTMEESSFVEKGPTTLVARDNMYTGFDLPSFVDKAFSQLSVDVTLTSSVNIGDYPTTLAYTQTDVEANVNEIGRLLPILAKPIVQKVVDGAVLKFDSILISEPKEKSFLTSLKGSITNAGPFDANISFPEGLSISWNGTPLGKLAMPDTPLVGDVGANLDVTGAMFQVDDVSRLEAFTEVLLTKKDFVWDIAGDGLVVDAMGISVPEIKISKQVTLSGMNSFKDPDSGASLIIIKSFDLPDNDPDGGITLKLQTQLTNPSVVGIELEHLGFNSFYGDENPSALGPVAASSFILGPSSTLDLPLAGRLIPQDSPEGLAAVSTVFTNYVHYNGTKLSVRGDFAGPSDVSWLNDGIKKLMVDVLLPGAPSGYQVIKSIRLEELKLMFDTSTAWNPATSSPKTNVAFQLPFAFPLDINRLSQKIVVSYEGGDIALLDVPEGPGKTDVSARTIELTFDDVPFAVYPDVHSQFSHYLADVTAKDSVTFGLSGTAITHASTAVGQLTISDIHFDVETSILGLQNLGSKPVEVSNLDVAKGYFDFLQINLETSIANPSNITLGIGDTAFGLVFQDKNLGTVNLVDLLLNPGDNAPHAAIHFQPQGDALPAGRQLLQNFISNVTTPVKIQGSTSSTAIESLQEALSGITLASTVPPYDGNLVTGVSLKFPQDIRTNNGTASATSTVQDPFTASLGLTHLVAKANYGSVYLGEINTDLDFSVPGHGSATTSALPFNFNLVPSAIVALLEQASAAQGVDLGPLTDVFKTVLSFGDDQESPVKTTIAGSSAPQCNSGHQFDVNHAILASLQNMRVDLSISSNVKLDDYSINLDFDQRNVPAATDDSALYLITVVAPPAVQNIVDNAELTFKTVDITGITDDGFEMALEGSLLNTGPFDATLEFPDGAIVTWEGKDIAKIDLPSACASADDGIPNYNPKAKLTITDQGGFTDFATSMLHTPSFEWTISTKSLRLTALGVVFDNVSLTKKISLKAFNNLPGVTISNFNLPQDDPNGGITISTDSTIPSPAQLGIDLGDVTFNAFYEGTLVGPLSTSGFILAPQSDTSVHLNGRMVPGQDTQSIGKLFSAFLGGQNSSLEVVGDSVKPNGNEVGWLTTAFKTLKLDVTLPGEKYEIINSISLTDLEVEMTDASQAYNAKTSSTNTVASYTNPFGFSLQAIQASEAITLSVDGHDVAELKLPMADVEAGVSTGKAAPLILSFKDQDLHALDNGAFESFFASVTDGPDVKFELSGTADVLARTAIGDVPISGIPFKVPSELKGINQFGQTAELSNASVTGSTSEYIRVPLDVKLNNPSNISLNTNDVHLPAYYKDVSVGDAVLSTLDLKPGENMIASEFHYGPPNANDTTAQSLLADFLTTGGMLPITIRGGPGSSPYQSLVPALEGVTIKTGLQALGATMVTHINVMMSLDTVVEGIGEGLGIDGVHPEIVIDFDAINPLDSDLVIEFVQCDSGVGSDTIAHFDQPFSNFVIPAKGKSNSGPVPHVVLTQGLIKTLPSLGKNLDIATAMTSRVGDGSGYQIPWLKLDQTNIPTTYKFTLGGIDIDLTNIGGLMNKAEDDFKIKTASITPSAASSGASSSHSSATASANATSAQTSSASQSASNALS